MLVKWEGNENLIRHLDSTDLSLIVRVEILRTTMNYRSSGSSRNGL